MRGGELSEGGRALHWAADKGHAAVVGAILDAYPGYINIEDDNGYSALHIAVYANSLATVTKLIEKGADVNTVSTNDDYGKLPALHIAVANNFTEIVEELLKSGDIDIELKANGETALEWAARGLLHADTEDDSEQTKIQKIIELIKAKQR